MIRLAAVSHNPCNSSLAISMLDLEKYALRALCHEQNLENKRCQTAAICRQSVVRLLPDASQLKLETQSRDRAKTAMSRSPMHNDCGKMTSARSQSARYYRTKYHHVYDSDPTDASLPAPRSVLHCIDQLIPVIDNASYLILYCMTACKPLVEMKYAYRRRIEFMTPWYDAGEFGGASCYTHFLLSLILLQLYYQETLS